MAAGKIKKVKKYSTAAAVQKGIKWLDKNEPEWAMKIDLRTLRMDIGQQCMLGQCFGEYFNKIQELMPPKNEAYGATDAEERKQTKWAVERGFHAHYNASGRTPNGAWEKLGLAWAPHIATRQVYGQPDRD